MTVEEFMANQKDRLKRLKEKYALRFGENAPDLEEAAFWGSEVDLLKDAIETGVPIVIKKLDEKADL